MDLYDVHKYTDEQLYDILDMQHPTDRELEAKIIQMIRKYEDIPTNAGKQLYDFFNRIYKRFFETDSDEDDDNIEGMTNPESTPVLSIGPTESPSTSVIGYQPQNLQSVHQLDYSPDKLQLNPLLTQTIKRVISIDSQYRNITTDPSTTNFSFDLSEPLRDVVSLKLYSIQIPFSWYTIGKNFGSNFFFIKGNTTGVSNNSYKIEIPPGNYDQTTLPTTINQAFQDISNSIASDINFNGLPLIEYNESTAKTTIQLNIQNTFNETYYNLAWFSTPPLDLSLNNYSIPGYMGFNNSIYTLNSISSNQTYYLTDTITTQYSQNFTLDSSNNYFTVVQYLGYDQFTGYDSRSKILNTYTIQLMNNGFNYTGTVTRQNIIDATNLAIQQSNLFDNTSQIQRIDITDPAKQNYKHSYFQLSLTLNRLKTKYVPNSKILVIFPTETIKLNQYGEPFTIWQYQPQTDYSAFYFDYAFNDFSHFISESPAINSTFEIDTSTNIFMTCTTPTYNTGLNDFSMNIQSGIYNTLTQYLFAINTSFSNQNINGNTYFNMTNTNAFINTNNSFNLQIDLTKSFTNKSYKVIIDSNSFLTRPKNPSGSPNFDCSFSIVNIPSKPGSTNLNDISYINISIPKLTNGYTLDTSCVFIIEPDIIYGDTGNGASNPIKVTLSSQQFPTYQSITSAIQTAIITSPITSTVNTQTPFSRTIFNVNDNPNNIDISLNLNAYYYLGESDYILTFNDATIPITDITNSWYIFNLDVSYNLSTIINDGYALITGKSQIGSASKQINIIDNCNNTITFYTTNSNSPDDSIVITIPPNLYSIGSLYSTINTAFSQNPKTYGTNFKQIIINNEEHTQLWVNINRVFTSQDYILDFYNPINFVSCYSGSKSVQNTTWDTTIGWMLGFRDYTQYFLTPQNQTPSSTPSTKPYYLSSINGSYIITPNIDTSSNLTLSTQIYLTSDTALSTNLYNYFLISLDDFIQNHLNDGLVTITRSQTSIQIPDYSYSTTQTCDPATGELVSTATNQINSDNVTNAQLYSLNQSVISQQNPSKQYSPGPFIKDLFGIIPYKPPSAAGDYYTEFGGTLQNQERLYFGPVNIRKMTIQLLTDRGTLLDLNGSNWSFSFICEQLYRTTIS